MPLFKWTHWRGGEAPWSSDEHWGLRVWAMVLGHEFDSRVCLKTRWTRWTTWWQKITKIIKTAKRVKSHQKILKKVTDGDEMINKSKSKLFSYFLVSYHKWRLQSNGGVLRNGRYRSVLLSTRIQGQRGRAHGLRSRVWRWQWCWAHFATPWRGWGRHVTLCFWSLSERGDLRTNGNIFLVQLPARLYR